MRMEDGESYVKLTGIWNQSVDGSVFPGCCVLSIGIKIEKIWFNIHQIAKHQPTQTDESKETFSVSFSQARQKF